VLVLGFDTATPAVSVALHDGERVVSAAFAVDARRHGELLMPMIAKVMADAGAARGVMHFLARVGLRSRIPGRVAPALRQRCLQTHSTSVSG